MLSKSDMDLLTQTGPGTPMGELFRRYWIPALLPTELPEGDCPPVRLRMLSEDLIAWRNTDGSLGCMQNACPHRGASMFFGRNEENGLRCVYHGWKFDAEGNCTDMPNEPAESNFKHKIKAAAYPLAEWGGIIWIYMGPRDLKPDVPQFEWCYLPAEQKVLSKWYQCCNYAQGVEGDLDTTHVSFMHREFDPKNGAVGRMSKRGDSFMALDGAPMLTVREADYGFAYGARRNADDGAYYWRVTQFLQPFYSMIPSQNSNRSGGCWIPIDDEHCMGWRYAYDLEQPIPEEKRWNAGGVPRLIPGTIMPLANASNDYLIDRAMQAKVNYSGIVGIRDQDTMGTESMAPIMDRTREHLGIADSAVILMRRQLLRMARQLQQGVEPYSAGHGAVYRIRALDVIDNAREMERVLQWHKSELVAHV